MEARKGCCFVARYREKQQSNKQQTSTRAQEGIGGVPRRVLEATMTENSAYLAWLESRFGSERGADFADNANNNH